MIEITQKIIGIGSSDGVTIPKKELKKLGAKRGDEVEVIVRKVSERTDASDQQVISSARKILQNYKQDFQNLAKR